MRPYLHCSRCGKRKPATPEYWHYRNVERKEFHDECKLCRNILADKHAPEDKYIDQQMAIVRQERHRLVNEKWKVVQETLWENGLTALEQSLNQYVRESTIPHAAELVESMTSTFGGPMGYASQLANIFYDPETKQSDRIRLLELYARCVLKNTEMGGAKKPIEMLSDEDLKKEQERVTKILNMQAARDAKEVA